MSQSRELIDEIYEHTGLIFSEFRAKGFQKLIDKKIAEARTPPPPSVKWPEPGANVPKPFAADYTRGAIDGWNACLEKCKELNAPKSEASLCSAHKPQDRDPNCPMCQAKITGNPGKTIDKNNHVSGIGDKGEVTTTQKLQALAKLAGCIETEYNPNIHTFVPQPSEKKESDGSI